MGILSSTVSITRYRVDGELAPPVMENVARGLMAHVIQEIDGEPEVRSSGWTSTASPLNPDFDGSSFVMGTWFVFSLRIDKKSLPASVIKKYVAVESAKKMAESDRDYLSRTERQAIRERVIDELSLRIPANPSTYDIIWHYEDRWLWFFSNQAAANEELETLFSKSFQLRLIRLFPYTIADLNSGLSEDQRDRLSSLTPGSFLEG